MKLTAKQEAFAQAIADGMTQADAYRSSFNVRPGTKPESIYDSASKVMANPEVAQRVAELKEKLEEKQLWSREMSVKALIQAYREGSGSVKVAAVKELNAMHGYNEPAKLNISGSMIQRIQREVIDGSDAND